jgi:hypothetical protein
MQFAQLSGFEEMLKGIVECLTLYSLPDSPFLPELELTPVRSLRDVGKWHASGL